MRSVNIKIMQTKLGSIFVVVLGLIAGVIFQETARAADYGVHGYAWVQADGNMDARYGFGSGPWVPNAFSWRDGVGQYTVLFSLGLNAATDGIPHVVAYGSNAHCSIVMPWRIEPQYKNQKLVDIMVAGGVRCKSPGGSLVDSAFVVSYNERGADTQSAYASVDGNGAISSRWNSSGGSTSLTKNSTGNYDVTFKNQPDAGSVQVTSTDSGRYCKVGTWNATGADKITNVLCFTRSGVAADSSFNIRYTGNFAAPIGVGAHGYASDSSTTDGYKFLRSYNSAGGVVVGYRTGTGRYLAGFGNLKWLNSAALITAVGTSSTYCTVQGWGPDEFSIGTIVYTSCFAADGSAANSRYAITYAVW